MRIPALLLFPNVFVWPVVVEVIDVVGDVLEWRLEWALVY